MNEISIPKLRVLDDLNNNLRLAQSCLKILCDHFDTQRSKDNLALDHFSVTRLFYEYNDLLSISLEKIKESIELTNSEVLKYESSKKINSK